MASRYPRNTKVDWRRLDMKTLESYIGHYNLPVRNGSNQEDLAVAVARHFELESKRLDEEEILNTFLSSYDRAFGKALGYESPAKRMKTGGGVGGNGGSGGEGGNGGGRTVGGGGSSRARQPGSSAHADTHHGYGGGGSATMLLGPAKEGEQVAAKPSEEEGWILATVTKYLAGSDEYVVADEDDAEKRTRVGRKQIRRLEDSVGAGLQKGASVLAVFPDTTAFYRGRISKPVKNRGMGGSVWLQFEEDEDEAGRTPHRQVPSKHVMVDPDLGGGGGGDHSDGGGGGGGEEDHHASSGDAGGGGG